MSKNKNKEAISKENLENTGHVEDSEVSKKTLTKEDALNNEIVRVFDEVLDSDEKIYKAYKPNKLKIFLANITTLSIPFLFLLAFSLIVVAIPEEGATINVMDFLYAFLAVTGLYIICLVFNLWFTALYFKNTFFAYTNKRLIIRTGIFGVDYKSLDIKNIGASDVYVSLLDKMLRKNTGTLRFGSNSSPINNSGSVYAYSFANIASPYKVYKEIKEHIEKVQKGIV